MNPDDGDDIDYWPFMIVGLAVRRGSSRTQQAANIREYLLRGGFMFCDSFFGDWNWARFEESLKRVFPDRPIIDLTDDHPIFHTVFDLPGMTKVMIPHESMARSGGRGGLGYGSVPKWRGVADDKGRLMMSDRVQQRQRRRVAVGRRSSLSGRARQFVSAACRERRDILDDTLRRSPGPRIYGRKRCERRAAVARCAARIATTT